MPRRLEDSPPLLLACTSAAPITRLYSGADVRQQSSGFHVVVIFTRSVEGSFAKLLRAVRPGMQRLGLKGPFPIKSCGLFMKSVRQTWTQGTQTRT